MRVAAFGVLILAAVGLGAATYGPHYDSDGGGTFTGGTLSSTLDMDGNQIILDADGDTAIEAIDTDDQIDFQIAGTDTFLINAAAIQGATAGTAALLNTAPSNTTPSLLIDNGDGNTGVGGSGSDKIALIAGAQTALLFTEAGSAITISQMVLPAAANQDGTCAASEWRIDNNATVELCYCTATNTMFCTAMTSGPAD